MRRRVFIAGAAGVALGPLAARAQREGRPRVAYLSAAPGASSRSEALRQGFRELGYVEGRTIFFAYGWADGDVDRPRDAAAELVHASVDVIVTGGPAATSLAAKADLAPALDEAKDAGTGALVDPTTLYHRTELAALAAAKRLPAIYSERLFVEAGGLMSYGASDRDLHRRAAVFGDKIPKGAKPADLPVEQPARLELVVNMRAAHQLALTLPPAVLVRADEVIE